MYPNFPISPDWRESLLWELRAEKNDGRNCQRGESDRVGSGWDLRIPVETGKWPNGVVEAALAPDVPKLAPGPVKPLNSNKWNSQGVTHNPLAGSSTPTGRGWKFGRHKHRDLARPSLSAIIRKIPRIP